MTTASENYRPYAAPANVISVLERVRSRNLPELIDNNFLRVAGIPDSVFGRVTQALQFLNLVAENGAPTQTLQALSAAPEAEYKSLLASALRDAYREDFGRVDPTQDSQLQIIDAFSPYQPRSQTQRMVILFLGLCREAGIEVQDAPRQRPQQERRASRTQSWRTPARTKAAPSERQEESRTGQDVTPQPTGLIFGVTEDDISNLDNDEFKTLWDALGTVARTRATARKRAAESMTPQKEDDTEVGD